MGAALRPLRLPGFANLAFAYLVNELGNWLGEIALAVLVFDQTGSPMATAALFFGMHFAPALLGAAAGLVAGGAPGAAVAAAALRGRGARLRHPRPVRQRLPARRRARPRDHRRLARLGVAGADPRRGRRRARPGRPAAGGKRAARTSPSPWARPAARRSPGSSSPGAGIQAALLADAVSFLHRRLRARGRAQPAACPDERGRRDGWAMRMRRGLAYVRGRVAAAPPARRPGARLHLLRARDPDRGRVREADPRRRRRRLRRAARQLGGRHGRRQPRSSPRCAASRCAACCSSPRSRSASPTSPPRSPPRSPSPAPPR